MEQYIRTDDGAELFCRVLGEGKPLLLIHGVMVDADFFTEVQTLLSSQYKVITYDRRGYSRSTGESDFYIRRQAEDAKCVIDALAGGSAIVSGCSAGGLIALKLKELYPEKAERIILHEPPIVGFEGVLSEEEEAWLTEIERLYELGKIRQAMWMFIAGTAKRSDPRAKPLPPEVMDRQIKNGMLFIREEFPEEFDREHDPIDFAGLKDKGTITVLAGESSGDTYCVKAAKMLADLLGVPMYYVPGFHNGAHDLPVEYAASLLGLLTLFPKGV